MNMAKKYKQPSIVSGMTINDIMNMDAKTFNKLNKEDLRKITGRLVSAGNKRLRSFEKARETTPATRHIEKSGGAFSTKGKNLNELRSEYVRAKNFLQSETGNRKGWNKVKKDTIESLKKRGVEIGVKDFDTLWKAYEKLKEIDPSVAVKNMKYKVLDSISEMTDDFNVDDIVEKMTARITEIYEDNNGGNDGGVSGFFEI